MGAEELIDAGWQARRAGRHGDAERALGAAIATARDTGATLELVRALKALAHVVRDAGQDERALPLYEEAVSLSRMQGDPLLLAHSVRHLGDLHRVRHRLAEAGACYAEAISLYRSAASPPPLDFANALRPAAVLAERHGELAAARELWSEAQALYSAAGADAAVAECARRIAVIDRADGRSGAPPAREPSR